MTQTEIISRHEMVVYDLVCHSGSAGIEIGQLTRKLVSIGVKRAQVSRAVERLLGDGSLTRKAVRLFAV